MWSNSEFKLFDKVIQDHATLDFRRATRL